MSMILGHLVRKAAVLVPRFQQLPPDGVEALVMLRQQRPVLLAHLQYHGHNQVLAVYLVLGIWATSSQTTFIQPAGKKRVVRCD